MKTFVIASLLALSFATVSPTASALVCEDGSIVNDVQECRHEVQEFVESIDVDAVVDDAQRIARDVQTQVVGLVDAVLCELICE